MGEAIVQFLSDMGITQYMALFIISMAPVLELRASVILGAAMGLDWYRVLAVCLLGNLVPIPFIILFLRPVLNYFKQTKSLSKLANWVQNRTMAKADKVLKYETFGLSLFVAIPLPGTGGWTGAIIAALLDMQLRRALPAICFGVLCAGILMTAASYGFFEALTRLFF